MTDHPRPIELADLIACVMLAIAALVLAALDVGNFVRVIAGFAIIFLLPGYSLAALLWGPRSGLPPTDRLIFSVGLSVSISVFTSLVLSLSGIGIYPLTVTVALGYETLSFAFVAIAVRWTRPVGSPTQAALLFRRVREFLARDLPFWNIIAVFLAASLVLIGVIFLIPQQGPGTQLQLLGSDGTVTSLPNSVVVNQTVAVIIGIHNGESNPQDFQVVVCLRLVNGTCPTQPTSNGTWGTSVSLAAGDAILFHDLVPPGGDDRQTLTFRVGASGDYVLSVSLAAPGVTRESHFPLAVV